MKSLVLAANFVTLREFFCFFLLSKSGVSQGQFLSNLLGFDHELLAYS